MENLFRTTVYHARISLVRTVVDYDSKSEIDLTEYISKIIKNDLITKSIQGHFNWHFGNIEDDKDCIYCRLGKLRKRGVTTQFDDKTKKFIEIESQDQDAFISHILFDKKSHFLLFEERPELGYKELMYVIVETVRKQFNREIHIDILPNNVEVNKLLKEAVKVTKATFLLKPSNPDNSEDLRKMDELIRDIRAKKAKMEFDNDEGLNFKDSKTFSSALSLSNRGFGTFNLDYEYDDGQKRKFSSKKKQLKETISKPSNDEKWKKKLIEMLKQTIGLLNRK